MTKETLLEKGLTEEQARQVMEDLNGSFVPKSRFNEVNQKLKTAEETISQRDQQLEQLKKASGDNEALKEQITKLQSENKQQKEAHDAELKSLKISAAVDNALTAARAKNNTAAKALLSDFLSEADLLEDGTVKGLDKAVKALRESKETAFLFETATVFNGAKPGEKSDLPTGAMTLEQLRSLTPTQRYEFSTNHPEEYRQLYGGN